MAGLSFWRAALSGTHSFFAGVQVAEAALSKLLLRRLDVLLGDSASPVDTITTCQRLGVIFHWIDYNHAYLCSSID